MSQLQQVLERLQNSRQNAILQQQPLSSPAPPKIRCLAGPISASTFHVQVSMPSSSKIHEQAPITSSNVLTPPTQPHKTKSSRVHDEMPGNIRTMEDHLRTQLRQERARIQCLTEELHKNDPTTLREANQTLQAKLQLATDRITKLEEENHKLLQNQRQNLTAENVLSRVIQEDPAFVGKLHAAQLALLNPNPPCNVNTMSRKLMRKQARLQAYNRKKEAETLLQDDTNAPKQTLQPLPPPVNYTPLVNEYIDLDFE